MGVKNLEVNFNLYIKNLYFSCQQLLYFLFQMFLCSQLHPFAIPLPRLIVCKRCTTSEIRLMSGELPESQSCVGTGGEWTEVSLAENVINCLHSGEIWTIIRVIMYLAT